MNKLQTFIDVSNAYMQIVKQTIEEAYQSFQNLFTQNGISHIDIGNYADQFQVMCDDGGSGDNQVSVHVVAVEYEPGYGLYLIDDEGNQWESCLWDSSMIVVFWTAVQCLNDKFEDYKKFKNGVTVKWMDPEIEDYDPEDREDQLSRKYKIFGLKVPAEEITDDTIIKIADRYGEAEALASELVYVRG